MEPFGWIIWQASGPMDASAYITFNQSTADFAKTVQDAGISRNKVMEVYAEPLADMVQLQEENKGINSELDAMNANYQALMAEHVLKKKENARLRSENLSFLQDHQCMQDRADSFEQENTYLKSCLMQMQIAAMDLVKKP